jgi:cell division transport system permease protein
MAEQGLKDEPMKHWRSVKFDFPFSAKDSYAALPWVLAFMVFLTVLSLSLALNVALATRHWHLRYDHRITLHIPASTAHADDLRARMAGELKDMAGVRQVVVIQAVDVERLLAPWVGSAASLKQLPLPLLTELVLDPAQLDPAKLSEWLSIHYPDAQLDDHGLWLEDFNRMVHSMGWLSLALVVMIVAITSIILVMSTRTELALHKATLQLLRALGAEDEYIVAQFQAKALHLCLRGTAAGLVAGMVVLVVFDQLTRHIQAPYLPLLSVSFWHVVLWLAIGLSAIGLTVFSARTTTLRELTVNE